MVRSSVVQQGSLSEAFRGVDSLLPPTTTVLPQHHSKRIDNIQLDAEFGGCSSMRSHLVPSPPSGLTGSLSVDEVRRGSRDGFSIRHSSYGWRAMTSATRCFCGTDTKKGIHRSCVPLTDIL